MKSALAVVAAASVIACSPAPLGDVASAQLFAEAIPICTLLAKPQSFVGKHVYVSGYLFYTPDGAIFRDWNCDRGEMPLSRENYDADNRRAKAILRNAWGVNRRAHVSVVMSGILKDNYKAESQGFMCSAGGLCQRYSLQSDSLIAARQPSTKTH